MVNESRSIEGPRLAGSDEAEVIIYVEDGDCPSAFDLGEIGVREFLAHVNDVGKVGKAKGGRPEWHLVKPPPR
jgi:hypothetical protein